MTDLSLARDIVAEFRSKGIEPEGYTLTSYAAVQAFAAAAKATKSLDGEKLSAWLRANPVQSAIGELSWDLKGDLTKFNYAWYVWRDHDRQPLLAPIGEREELIDHFRGSIGPTKAVRGAE